ncbi:MAG TPA: flagellar hook protein FlgE [Aquimonas sp.]|nr:flagellar hook protein FlgE [Aquimonas sp.]HRF52838.1 flagellar hook protein FlgE [Aquimonas sp.]
MSFRIALSGIGAANSALNTTANNIANVDTPGFKRSRAEFGDLFANSGYGLSRNTVGSGVRVAGMAQQFAQGTINFTNNALDLAITGNGFFTLSRDGGLVYSRAGNFGVDDEGYVVNPVGDRLQVFTPVVDGTGTVTGFNTGQLTDLRLTNSESPPAASTTVDVGTNLPADADVPTVAPFVSTDSQTYNHSTSITTYDSLGVAHTATLYYVKTANPNEWELYTEIDGTAVSGPDLLQYDSAGALTTPASGTLTLPAFTPTTGAAPMTLTLELGESTQFGSNFSVNRLVQDGFATGRLTSIDVGGDGIVTARYTNGQATQLGQVALTNFANPQGLLQLGDTSWAETADSGAALRGAPETSSLGSIQSGALEASNVDLTEQLVEMINAQRNFQANAQMITTADQITQTVINIR